MGGLMDYKARFYSPYLNHFIQPDTIIPDLFNPQAWNRFGYVHNNPINFNDPSGHVICDEEGVCLTHNKPFVPKPTKGGAHQNRDDDNDNVRGNGLNVPVSNEAPGCHNFSGEGYACKLLVTEENFNIFEDYHTQFRIGVRVLYYGTTVLLPTLVMAGITRSPQVAMATAALTGILAITGDEYIVQPGLREVDKIHQQFSNAVNNGEITIGRLPDTNNRLVGNPNDYIEVNTVIGKAYVDLMMVASYLLP